MTVLLACLCHRDWRERERGRDRERANIAVAALYLIARATLAEQRSELVEVKLDLKLEWLIQSDTLNFTCRTICETQNCPFRKRKLNSGALIVMSRLIRPPQLVIPANSRLSLSRLPLPRGATVTLCCLLR